MTVRTYRAGTMKEALAQVRRDLGGGAVIVGTREVRRRRLFGLGAREVIEVTASDGSAATATAPAPAKGATAAVTTPAPTARPVPPAVPAPSGALHAQFGEQLSRLPAMVEDLSRHGRIDHLLPELPSELVPTYAQLLEAEVPEVLARRLVRHVAVRLEAEP